MQFARSVSYIGDGVVVPQSEFNRWAAASGLIRHRPHCVTPAALSTTATGASTLCPAYATPSASSDTGRTAASDPRGSNSGGEDETNDCKDENKLDDGMHFVDLIRNDLICNIGLLHV